MTDQSNSDFRDPHGALEPLTDGRHERRVTGLYAGWIALAWLASAGGVAPLQADTGLILAIGLALTAGLFHVLARMPARDRPPAPANVVAQSGMGILWATLYGYFAGGQPLLAPAMYVCAVLIAVPHADHRWLRRLMIGALVALGAVLVLKSVIAPGAASLAVSLAASAALGGMLLVVDVTARQLELVRTTLGTRNDDLRRSMERLSRRVEWDPLTSSFNRRHIMDMLTHEKARVDRTGASFCVCMLDIDHFKAMNERYGNLTGERILAAFARRLRGELRTMDSVNRNGLCSSVGRYAGEEFVVVLPDTSLRGALRAAERIRGAVVRRPFNGIHQVTVSIGIAGYRSGETIASLLGRADEALSAARHGGRNRVHCATPDGGPSAVIMPDIPAAS